jgi:hypothetical protein
MSTRRDYVKRIKAALGKSVVGFIEAGRELTKAKKDLDAHGEWMPLVEVDLGMSISMADRLMKIGSHPILSKSAHGPNLPPAWRTIYELTKVPPHRLEAKLKDGTINPQMGRKDVAELLPARRNKKKPEPEPQFDESEDDEQTIWRRGLVHRTLDAIAGAEFEDWSQFKIDRELVRTVKQAADAWGKLAVYIEELSNAKAA